jgi:acyl-CoA synthetase (AMP-forming)/AMP-acid ligase II
MIPDLPFPDLTIAQTLEHRAAVDGTRLAFSMAEDRITWGELHDRATRIAAALEPRVARGERVALVMHAGIEFVVAFYAIQHAGAVSCAFNPYVPVSTLARRVARIRPALVIASADLGEALLKDARETGLRVTTVGDLDPGTFAARPEAPDDPAQVAILQPTSGTSGDPRAAMITHRNALAAMTQGGRSMDFRHGDRFIAWVPPWHDLGLFRFVFGSCVWGGSVHLVAPAIQTIPEWLESVSLLRGNVTGAPDFAYRIASRMADPGKVNLESLRDAVNGGEPVRLSTIRAFEERFHVRGVVLPGYGLAEATLGVAAARPGDALRVDDRGNVACGRPMEGVEVRIDSETGIMPGEILVRGVNVFAGYFENPEATAEALRNGWLHTGDIGYQDSEGYLYVLGRRKAMLKRAGAVLPPRELEDAALTVPAVKVAAAISLPGPERTTEGIMVIVEADVQHEDDRRKLEAAVSFAIRDSLGFAVEKVLVAPRKTIPRTYNGKIRYEALGRLMTQQAEVTGASLHSDGGGS